MDLTPERQKEVDDYLKHPFTITYWKKYCAFVVTKSFFRGVSDEGVLQFGAKVVVDTRPASYHEWKKEYQKTHIIIPAIQPEMKFSLGEMMTQDTLRLSSYSNTPTEF